MEWYFHKTEYTKTPEATVILLSEVLGLADFVMNQVEIHESSAERMAVVTTIVGFLIAMT